MPDSAAFGPYMDVCTKLTSFLNNNGYSIHFYHIESFEQIALQTSLVLSEYRTEVLLQVFNTADYADSRQYASWERFYTALFEEQYYELTKACSFDKVGLSYKKGNNIKSFLLTSDILDEIRVLLKHVNWEFKPRTFSGKLDLF